MVSAFKRTRIRRTRRERFARAHHDVSHYRAFLRLQSNALVAIHRFAVGSRSQNRRHRHFRISRRKFDSRRPLRRAVGKGSNHTRIIMRIPRQEIIGNCHRTGIGGQFRFQQRKRPTFGNLQTICRALVEFAPFHNRRQIHIGCLIGN